MKLSANGWSHVGLRVTDLARAKRFYVDTLGCPLVRETEGARQTAASVSPDPWPEEWRRRVSRDRG